MPEETVLAIKWALNQSLEDIKVIEENKKVDEFLLSYFVREYFNNNDIEYSTFSFKELEPFLKGILK